MQRVLKVAPAAARIFSACAAVLPVANGIGEVTRLRYYPAGGEGAGAGVCVITTFG